MRYALARRENLLRYLDDGCLAIDNNPAERALRGIALGCKNYLFAGSDAGRERAAAIYSLIETARLNGRDAQAYLTDVIARIGRQHSAGNARAARRGPQDHGGRRIRSRTDGRRVGKEMVGTCKQRKKAP